MSVYYTVFLLTIILCRQLSAKNEKDYLRKLIIVFLPLFVYGALRVDYGIDYTSYENDYYEFHNIGWGGLDEDHHWERGYQVLNIIMPSWRSLVVLTALSLCLSWILLCYRYIKNNRLILTICLLFLAGNFTVFTPLVTMRNGIAITCFVVSLPFIIERKYIYALAIAFAAHYIHSSILMFGPLALLVGINTPISKKEVMLWGSVFVLLFFTGSSGIMERMTSFISMYLDRYETVLDYMKESTHVALWASIVNALIWAMLLKVFYINRDSLTKVDNSIFRISFIYLLCPFLGALGGARMQSYFLPIFIVTIVRMYDLNWPSKDIKFVFYSLIFLMFLYLFFYVWQWNNPYFVFQTYHSIFD